MSTTTAAPDRAEDAVTFGLEYDGPALSAHEMDVRDLARALLSTADLFQELNGVMNPTAPNVAVNVRATSEGSFLVELRILFEIAEQGLLTHPVTAASTLIGLVAGSGYLIGLLKKRLGGREVSQEPVDNDMVRITFPDGTTLEIPRTVLQASNMVTIQRDLAEVVQPLNREGVDTLTIRRDDIVIATIGKEDAAAFTGTVAPPTLSTLSVSEREMYLTIRSAGFATGRWSFTDGASNFVAVVRDDDFLSRVHAGEAFSELDVLRCLVKETQTRDERGLHASIEVLEVREHLPPAQAELFSTDKPHQPPALGSGPNT